MTKNFFKKPIDNLIIMVYNISTVKIREVNKMNKEVIKAMNKKETKGDVEMVFKKAKLFWKNENDRKIINSVFYDDNIEYYTFLQKYKSKGYRQVIITTEIMIQLLRIFVIKKGFVIYKIEFAKEDCELENEIKNLLRNIENNPACFGFGYLINNIKFLSEQSSIDIRRVYIKGKYNGKFAPNFYIQSNGILGINAELYDDLSNEISTLVERCLLG